MSFPVFHSWYVLVPLIHWISSSLFTFSPWSVLCTFVFFPSTNSHFCSLTVTKPARSSSPPIITAKGTSSLSPAANCAGSLGLFLAKKSVYEWFLNLHEEADQISIRTLIPASLRSPTKATRSVNNPALIT